MKQQTGKAGRTHSFNKVWRVGRFMLQVMLSGFQKDHLAIRIVPSFTLATNHRMVWAIGLGWIFSDVNFGWMQPDFLEGEINRAKYVAKQAAKRGLTIKQQKLQWENY